ncbi:MAG: TonB-dependent receptor [Ignavibacteria bacterium]
MKKIRIIYLIAFILLQKANALSESYQQNPDSTSARDSLRTYTTQQIVISDKSEFFDEKISSFFSRKINFNEKLSSVTIGNLLASKSGIFNRTYGAEGSLQTISIRGAGSEYTSVFINGINYNNSLNGVFDFSKFSSEEISELIIKKGNDFDPLNNNPFGGVIELNPFEKSDTTRYSLKIQRGSFGFTGFNLNTSGLISSSYYKLNLTQKSSKNNYEYTFNDEKGIRQNSDVKQFSVNSAFISQFFLFNRPLKLLSFVSYLDKNLGLPNFVSSNRHLDSKTREIERNFSASVNSKILFSNFLINGLLGYQFNKLSIDDPLLSINLKTKFFQTNERSLISKFFIHLLLSQLNVSAGFTSSLEKFDRIEVSENENTNNQFNRRIYSFNLTSNYSQKILKDDLTLNFALLFSQNFVRDLFINSKENIKFSNSRTGISINSSSLKLTVYGNIGTGTRLPNYYEIIFSKLTSLNSKELENEKIFNFETGIKYNPTLFSAELTYFNFDVTNKIIWQPQRVAFFSPINAGKVNSKGIEINLESFKFLKNFYFNSNYTFTSAVKKSKLGESDKSYNKQLPYVPKHKVSISVQYVNQYLNIDLTTNYYSRRFITEDNDVLFSLEPVYISNLSTTYNFKILSLRFSTQLLIQNLFNKSYQLIQSFPMPGREYRLTIQMEVK